ncbi:hypothetical protein VLL09_04745 [Dehalococcoides mccartyi]|uniref:Uncharacterized protein n=1 Tax=Dehalococcoides mccartyi TaxID=61435 RepID=A0AB38Z7Z6_9CHLR|nr:hypothetical protein [Dehalococcoides mccartyi]WRO06701.1 hypothetical protein VLL09_04745 [Dehalococcoides mccartyi]
MPIKWSPLRVTEAMDMVEEFINQASEPLEQAKLVAIEARKIPNLPQYVDQHLSRLISEIERVTGGTTSWNNQPYDGAIKSAVSSIRKSIPEDAIEEEQKAEENKDKYGTQMILAG